MDPPTPSRVNKLLDPPPPPSRFLFPKMNFFRNAVGIPKTCFLGVLEFWRISATDFDEFPDNFLQKPVINRQIFRPNGRSKPNNLLDPPSRANKLLDPTPSRQK